MNGSRDMFNQLNKMLLNISTKPHDNWVSQSHSPNISANLHYTIHIRSKSELSQKFRLQSSSAHSRSTVYIGTHTTQQSSCSRARCIKSKKSLRRKWQLGKKKRARKSNRHNARASTMYTFSLCVSPRQLLA